jgi:hypothetical protein
MLAAAAAAAAACCAACCAANRYPITVGSMGMFASSCFSYTVCHILKFAEAKAQISWHYYATRIMPVGLFMALTLWTGNLVYLYLTVSFIQMLKAFTPVMTMLAAFLAGLEVPTKRLIGEEAEGVGGVGGAWWEGWVRLGGVCVGWGGLGGGWEGWLRLGGGPGRLEGVCAGRGGLCHICTPLYGDAPLCTLCAVQTVPRYVLGRLNM